MYEILYADDLIFTSEAMDGFRNCFLNWKNVLESKVFWIKHERYTNLIKPVIFQTTEGSQMYKNYLSLINSINLIAFKEGVIGASHVGKMSQ